MNPAGTCIARWTGRGLAVVTSSFEARYKSLERLVKYPHLVLQRSFTLNYQRARQRTLPRDDGAGAREQHDAAEYGGDGERSVV